MAILRLLRRRRRVLLMLLFMCLFWVVFLYLSMPTSAGFQKKKGERDKTTWSQKSVVADTLNIPVLKSGGSTAAQKSDSQRNVIETIIRATQKHRIPAMPLQPPNMNMGSPVNISANNASAGSNHSKKGVTSNTPKKIGKVDQMLELGAKMKNKTLQKLSDLGFIAKPKPVIKLIGKTSILNITMSSEEIMFIFKALIQESEQKKTRGLMPNKTTARTSLVGTNNTNSSLEGTANMAKQNLCDCSNSDCTCCAHLQLIKLHVNRKACANFTFVPKSQELSFNFLLDGSLQFTETISAEHPPKICLGSISKLVEICVDFYNMSFTVNMHEDHKTQLNGCLNFGFNIFNKTISTFPLGCFQIPSGSHKEDHHQIPLLGNWVP